MGDLFKELMKAAEAAARDEENADSSDEMTIVRPSSEGAARAKREIVVDILGRLQNYNREDCMDICGGVIASVERIGEKVTQAPNDEIMHKLLRIIENGIKEG